jgi:hypothetical protein
MHTYVYIPVTLVDSYDMYHTYEIFMYYHTYAWPERVFRTTTSWVVVVVDTHTHTATQPHTTTIQVVCVGGHDR